MVPVTQKHLMKIKMRNKTEQKMIYWFIIIEMKKQKVMQLTKKTSEKKMTTRTPG